MSIKNQKNVGAGLREAVAQLLLAAAPHELLVTDVARDDQEPVLTAHLVDGAEEVGRPTRAA